MRRNLNHMLRKWGWARQNAERQWQTSKLGPRVHTSRLPRLHQRAFLINSLMRGALPQQR